MASSPYGSVARPTDISFDSANCSQPADYGDSSPQKWLDVFSADPREVSTSWVGV
jgi:hypothetical protein